MVPQAVLGTRPSALRASVFGHESPFRTTFRINNLRLIVWPPEMAAFVVMLSSVLSRNGCASHAAPVGPKRSRSADTGHQIGNVAMRNPKREREHIPKTRCLLDVAVYCAPRQRSRVAQ